MALHPVSDLGAWGFVLFWGLTALAGGIFLYRAAQLWSYLRLGKKDDAFTHILKRTVRAIFHVFNQRCQYTNLRRNDRAGIGHMFMVWGFLAFVTYYTLFIVIASGFGIAETMEHNRFYAVYTWIMDIAAPFVMIGALWGIIRRYIVRPARIKEQRTFEAAFILFTVLVHPITHLGKISTQIANNSAPAGLGIVTPPISTWMSQFYTDAASLAGWHTFWFWSHWAFVLLVLGIIGFTRYLHVPAGILNDIFRNEPQPPKGKLSTIDLKDASSFGVSVVSNFTRKQLLDTYACVECGYCQDVCPANNTRKSLNPRLVIHDVKVNLLKNAQHLLKKKPPVLPLIGDRGDGSVSEEVIWDCTTCGACMEVCPMYVEHVPKLIDMRRYLVQMQAKFPPELLILFENMEQRSNPWGIAPEKRASWIEEAGAQPFDSDKTEYLFYVGCAGALDSRSRHVTIATAKVLDAAGVSWGVLGKDELCCGDSLRRLGNEYVFDEMAQKNIKQFHERGVKKIITQCPHCFNTLKNDYARYGIEYEVIHHTELINSLIEQGRLNLNSSGDFGKVVFHDSCYLGRYNWIYDQPRQAIASATGAAPAEMERNRQRSFCCGGGGGRMWLEESVGDRINVVRTEQALNQEPDTICTCCPYCMTMFEDGLKDKKVQEKIKVMDLSEIVAAAIK